MGTIVGQPDRIAVEFDLWPSEPEAKEWLFGTMCLWAAGQRIGRHDEQCAMTVALASLPHVLLDKGKRSDAALMAMPAAKAFSTMYEALYGDPGDRPDREIAERAERYERFEALPRGFDVFDGWHAFLIEDRIAARLLWRSPDDAIHEARIGAGEFDRVIDAFLTELERQSGAGRRTPEPGR
jgi:hypothetical protein